MGGSPYIGQTVRQTLGELAVNVLMYRIEHPNRNDFRKLALRPNLILRASCAAPPSGTAA